MNAEQLQGIANLCFDLAKAAFIGSLLSPIVSNNIAVITFTGLKGIFIGLIFTYAALLFLRYKGEITWTKTLS